MATKAKGQKQINFRSESVDVELVSVHRLREMQSQGTALRLLDVRTPGEYVGAHISGSYNVPLDKLNKYASELCECVDTPIIIVCQSGQRARRAYKSLRDLGMKNVSVLDGGVSKWSAAGFAVEQGAERLSLERQVRIVAGAIVAVSAVLAVLVHPLFAVIAALVGSGLVFAGVTNTCMLAMGLARLRYNRSAGCDVDAMVRALKQGPAPAETAVR